MTLSFNQKQKAFAALEYMMLVIVFVAALASFQTYIKRALSGQYRKVGETFAYGRQYSGSATKECAYEDQIDTWYEVKCFDRQVVLMTCKSKYNYETCLQSAMGACRSDCD